MKKKLRCIGQADFEDDVMSQNTSRLPTPLGWSDTDWLKRLQEWKERQEGEESPHPLAGLHINQGSYDAAADAYEAEYNAAHEAKPKESVK